MNNIHWTENVIIADADFVDRVTFDLIVNFERMLERRIPQADMARWAEYVALDGGLRQGAEQQTTVVLIHDKQQTAMRNFQPGGLGEELDGMAFSGNLGEFCFSTPCGEDFVSKEELFMDTMQTVIHQKEVKRIMLIPDEQQYNNISQALRKADNEGLRTGDDTLSMKRITLFAMQPIPGGNFRQEILGYSLMAALGIRGEELRTES